MRFRELQGTSIHAYILARRLDAVKSLLRKTRLPVNKIARQCGFADSNYLSHLFAKKVGCSMRRFRQAPDAASRPCIRAVARATRG